MPDYIPRTAGNKTIWLNNYAGKVVPIGTALGIPPEQLENARLKVDQLLTAMANTHAARAEYKKAQAIKDAQAKESDAVIRAITTIMKASPNWTDSMSKDLLVDIISAGVDTANYKAKLKATLDGDGVLLKTYKRGVEAVNIYTKLLQEPAFAFLQKVNRSTFKDRRPLKTPGVAEIRQYMSRAVIADEEIGHNSDIITISFGG